MISFLLATLISGAIVSNAMASDLGTCKLKGHAGRWGVMVTGLKKTLDNVSLSECIEEAREYLNHTVTYENCPPPEYAGTGPCRTETLQLKKVDYTFKSPRQKTSGTIE